MSSYDDDLDVSGGDLHDFVTMAMARRTLRSLVPDAPPTPSEQLALVLRDGVPATSGGSRWRRLTGRLAGLGVAAKLLLATGVAVAGVGGAATAVAIRHENSHHGDGVDSPRNHPVAVVPAPATTPRGADDSEPTAHPTTFGPAEVEHHGATSTSHDGEHSDDSGSGSHDSGSGSHDSGSDGTSSGSDRSGSGSGSSSGDGSGSTSGDSVSSGGSDGSSGTSGSSSGSSGDGGGTDVSGSGSTDGSGSGSSGGGSSDISGGTD